MTATPLRNLRVPDAEWDAWKTEAARRGMSVTAWVRDACNGWMPHEPVITPPGPHYTVPHVAESAVPLDRRDVQPIPKTAKPPRTRRP